METHLPKIRFQESPQWQTERLRKWLFEWNVRLALERNDKEPLEASSDGIVPPTPIECSSTKIPFDTNVRLGDIRLIPIAKPDSLDLPLYGCVLSLWPEEADLPENRLWVTCLFSSMGEPGLPSEWLTGENAPFSSLALWNSQLVPEGVLRESWCLETWPNSTRQKALAIYKTWFLGEDTPADLTEEVGPPIRCSNDPRNEYLLQEQERGRALSETIHQWRLKQTSNIVQPIKDNLIAFPSPSPTGLLAARDHAAERPLVTRLYRVTDKPASTIQISESVDPTKLAFEVIEDPSGLFIDAGIFDAHGKSLGSITDGIAFVDCPNDSHFALFAAEGTPIPLEETPDEY